MIREGILEGRKIGEDWYVYPTAGAELDRERRRPVDGIARADVHDGRVLRQRRGAGA